MNPLLCKSIFRNVKINLLLKEQISINLKIVLQKELHVFTCSRSLQGRRSSSSCHRRSPSRPHTASWCTWRSWAGRGVIFRTSQWEVSMKSNIVHHCTWSGACAGPLCQGKGQLLPLFSAFWPLLHFFVCSRNKVVKDSLPWTLLLHRRLCFLLMASLEASLI